MARRYFTAASPDNARPALLHTAHLWQCWTYLTDCVTAGTAVEREEIADRGEEWTEAFIAAMHRNAMARAPLVVRAVRYRSRHTRVGDLRSDELGSGYDLVFRSAICHMLSGEENCDLLARRRADAL